MLVGGRQIEARPGDLIWFLPGQDHQLLAASADYHMWITAFSYGVPERVESSAWLPASISEPRQLLRGLQEPAVAELADRCRLLALGQGKSFAVSELLVRAASAFAAGDAASKLPALHPAVSAAAAHLRECPEVNRPDLCRRLEVSPSFLSHTFAAQLGVTLTEYRDRARAARFLTVAEGGAPLTRAAFDAGFGSYAQCHRVFVKLVGMGPREYLRGPDRGRLMGAVEPIHTL